MTWIDRAPALLKVDLGECLVSDDPEATIVTYALGSCIAVVAWDRRARVGGMLHYSLPLSSINPEKALVKPTMFADTGVPMLFRSLYEEGANKKDLVVKAVGGARLFGDSASDSMDIGRRNYVVLRKMFWKNNILILAEDVGGTRSRTVRLRVADGLVTVSSQGEETVL